MKSTHLLLPARDHRNRFLGEQKPNLNRDTPNPDLALRAVAPQTPARMWGDVRWRAVAGGAAIVALALAAASRAEPPPVAQAPPPPRDGLAAKPAVPGTLGVKTRPLPKAGVTGATVPPGAAPPVVSPAPGAAPAATAAPSIVKVQGDRLTVQLSDVPIDEVLRRIAEPSKADISGAVTTPRNVTADFADVPLQDGLARLLGEQNFLLTYRVDGGLKRLTLMGGSTDAPVETRVVKTTPATPQQTPGDLLQRRIPVRGKLKGFLGEETATVQQLMDIALAAGRLGIALRGDDRRAERPGHPGGPARGGGAIPHRPQRAARRHTPFRAAGAGDGDTEPPHGVAHSRAADAWSGAVAAPARGAGAGRRTLIPWRDVLDRLRPQQAPPELGDADGAPMGAYGCFVRSSWRSRATAWLWASSSTLNSCEPSPRATK